MHATHLRRLRPGSHAACTLHARLGPDELLAPAALHRRATRAWRRAMRPRQDGRARPTSWPAWRPPSRALKPRSRRTSPRRLSRRPAWRPCACARPRCAPWAAGAGGARRSRRPCFLACSIAGQVPAVADAPPFQHAGHAQVPQPVRRVGGTCVRCCAPAATPRATARPRARRRPGAQATRARASACSKRAPDRPAAPCVGFASSSLCRPCTVSS